jgi:SAM-dependent methyltransferase
MAEKTRDIEPLCRDAYARSAPRVLGDQHRFLLSTLEAHLSTKENPTLAVFGPGGKVLPYSCTYTENGELGGSNRDQMKRVMGDGLILLLDYVVRNGLDKSKETLKGLGFFEEGYFKDKYGFFNHDSMGWELAPWFLEKSDGVPEIRFMKQNLRDKVDLRDNSIDAIDANISVHHASVTRAELERIYSDFYRVLKAGGLLHLGEGNTDMNYSEDKIIRIGQDLTSILDAPIFVSDEREKENGYEIHAFFEPNKTYENLPIVAENFQPADRYASVRVTEDGLVVVKATTPNQIMLVNGKTQEVADALHKKGYTQSFIFSDSIALPLIDPKMHEDVEGQIVPVDRYYEEIKQRVVRGYADIDDQLVAQISDGIELERGNARRATVEYYMGEKTIVDTLKKVGFDNIQVTHHETEPFYNITSKKPR